MSAVLTYSPSEVMVNINAYRMTDLVSVEVEWSTEAFSMVRGIRGRNTRRQSQDSSATLKLEFLQTSISNDILSELLLSDIALQSSRLQISIMDNSGSTKILSSEAFISSFPTVTFNSNLSSRVWLIKMPSTEATVNGNAKPLPDIFGAASSYVDDVTSKISGIF